MTPLTIATLLPVYFFLRTSSFCYLQIVVELEQLQDYAYDANLDTIMTSPGQNALPLPNSSLLMYHALHLSTWNNPAASI
ncbi:uncharacterized protein BT62DRAFT_929644, partial [Guyanagaster necrorhizus]